MGGPAGYGGRAFQNARRSGERQRVPGQILCAFYDLGGEGVAFHDASDRNQGSGALNALDGSYLNEFRADEPVGTSYAKANGVDDSRYSVEHPEVGALYVGWTAPGNWLRYSVEVVEPGPFVASLLYTSAFGGAIALTVDDDAITEVIEVPSTRDSADPLEWRQWHHWSVLRGTRVRSVQPGAHVFTLHTVRTGQMNYATISLLAAD